MKKVTLQVEGLMHVDPVDIKHCGIETGSTVSYAGRPCLVVGKGDGLVILFRPSDNQILAVPPTAIQPTSYEYCLVR